ncbi:cytochrome oxidase maturation protein, cbb3-type [Bacteriovorax sp. BAL6_X]|uniref:cbb3-type cytochrome oxidase assembly protein CcoS n=1 Tax=Bacteriovorax sp. BAL6_X TaxID=1201290 RepID=UPI0003863E52|nr:cbb3-type cytochrome oxidase assembly protein CcoS [Bacteriovorax sp. BAL6_X]EPZ50972.1 cytochrome oxidase maturation protein, cbb3-type [Bacteriovorax sp. BAL6_X]
MEVIIVLLPIAIFLAVGFLLIFIWATKSGQYDDLDTPSIRVLFEEENNIVHNQKKEE